KCITPKRIRITTRISDMEDLLLPNKEEALENAIQQKQELLTVLQVPRSKSSLEQRIQERDECTEILESEFQKAKKIKVDLTTDYVNKIDNVYPYPIHQA
ncbi:11916_t:CDS:1, partial [Gigaspora rosea]